MNRSFNKNPLQIKMFYKIMKHLIHRKWKCPLPKLTGLELVVIKSLVFYQNF